MKNHFLSILFILSISNSYSQVGVGTGNPKATLDIVGKPTVTTEIDGILIPRI